MSRWQTVEVAQTLLTSSPTCRFTLTFSSQNKQRVLNFPCWLLESKSAVSEQTQFSFIALTSLARIGTSQLGLVFNVPPEHTEILAKGLSQEAEKVLRQDRAGYFDLLDSPLANCELQITASERKSVSMIWKCGVGSRRRPLVQEHPNYELANVSVNLDYSPEHIERLLDIVRFLTKSDVIPPQVSETGLSSDHVLTLAYSTLLYAKYHSCRKL